MRGKAQFVVLAVLLGNMLAAEQEIAYVEVVASQQRTALRHPPAPPSPSGVGGGIGGGSVRCGAVDSRDQRAFRITLTWLDQLEYPSDSEVTFEVKLENTGTVPLSLPVYPHLSDLQPADSSEKFEYETLGLTLQVREPESPPSNAATVWLYGSPGRPGTMIQLPPGAWIRVRYSGPFFVPPTAIVRDSQLANASLTWGTDTFVPRPGGSFTNASNRAVPTTTGPDVSIHVTRATASEAR